MLVGNLVPFSLLMGAAVCGIQLCYLHEADGRRATWETLVKGLDYFLPSFVATLVTMVAFLVSSLPFIVVFTVGMYQAMVGSMSETGAPVNLAWLVPASMVALLVGFLLQVEILFFFMFAYVLIADKEMGGVQAVVVSTRAVWANFGPLVGALMLLSVLLLLPVAAPMVLAGLISWSQATGGAGVLGAGFVSLTVGMLAALFVSLVTLPLMFGVITVAYRGIFPAQELPQ
jgi:hypothetical protein